MYKDSKTDNNTFKWLISALAIVGGFYIFTETIEYFKHDDFPVNYNPRNAVNGIDTVYTKDSMYIINVSVKKVELNPNKETPDGEY